jgi:hypothetical protein
VLIRDQGKLAETASAAEKVGTQALVIGADLSAIPAAALRMDGGEVKSI